MSALVGTLAVLTLVWLALFALTSLAITSFWPALMPILAEGAAPAARARRFVALALVPWLVPTLVVSAILWPGFADLAGGHADHCLAHGPHLHLCLAHPRIALTPGLALALAGPGAWVLVWIGPRIAWGVRALRDGARLQSLPHEQIAPDVRRIESPRAFCFTAGMLAPTIHISDGLWRGLAPVERAVVLAHERAHARRRDPLTRLLAAIGSLGLGTRARHALLEALDRASERACDEIAAALVGDRLLVAETLLAVERLAGRAPARVKPAFGGTALQERVLALASRETGDLDERGDRGRQNAGADEVGLAALSLIGMSSVLWVIGLRLHHGLEHALARILSIL